MSHFKYFQFILLKFNNDNLNKFYLISRFYNGFKSLIKLQIKNGNQKLCNWKNLVQKAIKIKANASFTTFFMLKKRLIYYL